MLYDWFYKQVRATLTLQPSYTQRPTKDNETENKKPTVTANATQSDIYRPHGQQDTDERLPTISRTEKTRQENTHCCVN
jgi:hypothetical protein